VFETPTVATDESSLVGGDLPASAYRETRGKDVVGQTIEIVHSGDYGMLEPLLAWVERECLPEGSERQLSCTELGLPEGVATYRAFVLHEYVELIQPENRLEERFERYLAAGPTLIAAAESTDDQGLVFLEFGLHAPATLTEDEREPTYSFTLAIDGAAERPVQFYQTFELIYFVREQDAFPTEMTYIGPDAAWRNEARHAADERCRTADSNCVSAIEWPNGTWPSRQ
jgi:hypothetical protein